MSVSTDIVGRGWAFPLRLNERGHVVLVENDDEIEQAIRIILGTAQGERLMRPTFGSNLHNLVFAPINAETMALARYYVEEALAMWEPRVRIVQVEVLDPFAGWRDYPRQLGQLDIVITYEIKATLDERTLVYPFATIPEE